MFTRLKDRGILAQPHLFQHAFCEAGEVNTGYFSATYGGASGVLWPECHPNILEHAVSASIPVPKFNYLAPPSTVASGGTRTGARHIRLKVADGVIPEGARAKRLEES